MKKIILLLTLMLFISTTSLAQLSRSSSDVPDSWEDYICYTDDDDDDDDDDRVGNFSQANDDGEFGILVCDGEETFCYEIEDEDDYEDLLEELESGELFLGDCENLGLGSFDINKSFNFDRQTKIMTIKGVNSISVYDITGRILKKENSETINLNGINTSLLIISYQGDGFFGSFKTVNH